MCRQGDDSERCWFLRGSTGRLMEARPGISANEEARPLKHPWLGLILNILDGRLRLRHGVTEYTRCPN